MSNYRTAFGIAVASNLILAGALALIWWRWHAKPGRVELSSRPQSVLPASNGEAISNQVRPEAPETAEIPRVPLQLTPERVQNIGVQSVVIHSKPVEDEIRTVGNVEIDETRLAYVQVRFPGWIQKVFANSTYQYIRKGQPLFMHFYNPPA